MISRLEIQNGGQECGYPNEAILKDKFIDLTTTDYSCLYDKSSQNFKNRDMRDAECQKLRKSWARMVHIRGYNKTLLLASEDYKHEWQVQFVVCDRQLYSGHKSL